MFFFLGSKILTDLENYTLNIKGFCLKQKLGKRLELPLRENENTELGYKVRPANTPRHSKLCEHEWRAREGPGGHRLNLLECAIGLLNV